MGIPAEIRDFWSESRKNNSFLVASPAEKAKIKRAQTSTHEGVREGTKAAAVTCVASTIATLTAVRVIPWAKANLNYTAQALIISAASISAFFITADKTVLERARKNTEEQFKNAQKG